jgi:hypothetical protein
MRAVASGAKRNEFVIRHSLGLAQRIAQPRRGIYRPLTGPQPILGAIYVIKKLQFEDISNRHRTGKRKDIVVRICLHDVGDVAQTQQNGLRQSDLVQPLQRLKLRPL